MAAVLFLIFNRPDRTQEVFNEIRKSKPRRLFIAADGPRPHFEQDIARCTQARKAVANVDWECEVQTLYRDTNLGCKKAVSDAINWFFDQVEEGIILEDDCVPSQSFFGYCDEMLSVYRSDSRVMMVSGTNIMGAWKAADYFFSVYGGIWGWATWRRSWRFYDVNMQLWKDPAARSSVREAIANENQWKVREKLFDAVYSGEIDTWDYQWGFARMVNSGLSIVPRVNLVSNIGFGADATHTTSISRLSDRPRYEIELPLGRNNLVTPDREYDAAFFSAGRPSLVTRLKNRIFNRNA